MCHKGVTTSRFEGVTIFYAEVADYANAWFSSEYA